MLYIASRSQLTLRLASLDIHSEGLVVVEFVSEFESEFGP